MTTSPMQFIENTTLPAASAQLGTYQVPALSVDKIYEIILCNTHTEAVSVDIWFVPSGGSRIAANKILDSQNFIMSSGETKFIGLEQRLNEGSQIHGAASVDSVVSVRISGDRITR